MTASEETLGSAGERAALRRIFPRLPASEAQLLGPGDDAAVIQASDGRVVITTDMLIHGPDFRLAWSTPYELGWKAAATNLSDIAAMGAVPTALVVALAAPAATPLADLESIADGLREACEALAPGCGVVGGDLSVSSTLTVAVTAFGDLSGRAPILRSGAQIGDQLAYAGVLGMAAGGLHLLFIDALDEDGEPDPGLAAALRAEAGEVLREQLAPRPPIELGVVASDGGATSMLDVSDGLLLDAERIAVASGVQLDFSAAQLADDISAVASADPRLWSIARDLVLSGGEDHGLLATFPADVPLPAGFRQLGTVIAGSGATVDGAPYESSPGWDPFADWNGGAG